MYVPLEGTAFVAVATHFMGCQHLCGFEYGAFGFTNRPDRNKGVSMGEFVRVKLTWVDTLPPPYSPQDEHTHYED